MIIKRDYYLQQLINKKDSKKIKIITGLRRSGKSYLLSVLYKNYLLDQAIKEKQIIHIELDDEKNENLLRKGNLRQYVEQLANDSSKKYYIILDEIQLVDNFVRAVNSLNKHDNYDLYITGSNSKFLSKDINDEFKDRGSEINIRPLSFSEFYGAYRGNKNDALKEYLLFGGMPGLFEEKTNLDKKNYLNNLMKKVYIDDIKRNINTPLVEELSATVDALCSVTGNLTNPLNMANYLFTNKKIKIDNETIANFFAGIEDAYLFDEVKRFNIKGLKYLHTPSKYYCRDIGLRNVRLNFSEQNVGFLIENCVYNELAYRGYSIDVGFIEQKFKDKNKKWQYRQLEVDFIARLFDQQYYIQIVSQMPNEERLSNELESLRKVPGSFKKVLVINQDFNSFTNKDGILFVSLQEFLINKDLLK